MIRVASYCRVSTDKEDQANSFDAQQRYFKEYIDRQLGWELYRVYADEGITGTSTQKRVQFNKMVQDAYAGKFELIITKEISRFSRNILDTISYTRDLRAIGVGVLFMTENLNTMNPESEMLLTFMGTIAQEESRRTSIRVKWGQTRQMEQGVVFGPSLLGYDVTDGKIRIDPDEADLVRLIFRQYGVEKKGTSAIARNLREAGCRTHTGNTDWSASHIIKILRNEKYVGDLVQKKSITPNYLTHQKKANHGEEELVVIHDHHEPIISRELWTTVQTELAKRNKRAAESTGHSNRYIFSGKIKCGNCGSSYVGRYKYLKDGAKIRRWSCATSTSQGSAACNIGKLIRDDDAIHMLKTALRNLRLDREAVVEQVTEIARNAIRMGETEQIDAPVRLQWQIDRIAQKKATMLDAYFEKEITKQEMTAMKAKYDEQLRRLQLRMEQAQLRTPAANDADKIRLTLEAVLAGETESEGLYKKLVEQLTVYRDRHMELKLNHLPQIFRFEE